MKKHVFARNILLSAGMVLLSVFCLSLVFSAVSYTYVIRDRRNMLASTAELVSDVAAAVSEVSELDDWEVNLSVSSVSRATGFHVFICDADGRILVCSDAPIQCTHLGLVISRTTLAEVSSAGTLRTVSELDGFYDGKRYLAAAPVVTRHGELVGYVFASSEVGFAVRLWRAFSLIQLLTACFILLIAIPVAIITSRREAAPLKELASAARQFAKGNLTVRVQGANRSDEVGEVCEAFNQMADALEKSEQRRKDFISGVSHELKTPMTTISGFADGLLDGTIPQESAPHYLAIISDETKRLSRLVRQMLDISRMKDAPTAASGSFDVAETLRRGMLNLEGKIREKKLILLPELPEGVLNAVGSGDDAARIFYNILDNAVKFADEGSELTVKLFKQGNKAFVSVVDHGETIPEEELPEIFDRFHKSDRSRSLDRDGVGLGLYIVKTILDNMGEDIWVRSRDGETEFRFSLTLKTHTDAS